MKGRTLPPRASHSQRLTEADKLMTSLRAYREANENQLLVNAKKASAEKLATQRNKHKLKKVQELHETLSKLEKIITLLRVGVPRTERLTLTLHDEPKKRIHSPAFELLIQLRAMDNPAINAIPAHLAKEVLLLAETQLNEMRDEVKKRAWNKPNQVIKK